MDRVAGIILAGGKGERIGGHKPLLPFGDGMLLDAIIARAAPQVDRLGLNVPNADEALYRERYGARFDIVTDPFEQGTGPLAGVVAGLAWAKDRSADWLATFPCDAPLLPTDLVARLMVGRADAKPVMADDGERLQGLCALWPVGALDTLRDAVVNGSLRSLFQALEMFEGTRCAFDSPEAFFNVNTREDLATAEGIVRNR